MLNLYWNRGGIFCGEVHTAFEEFERISRSHVAGQSFRSAYTKLWTARRLNFRMVKVKTPKRVNRSKICPVPYVPVVDAGDSQAGWLLRYFHFNYVICHNNPWQEWNKITADLKRTPGAKQLKRSLLESILCNQFIMQSVIIQQYFNFQDVL